MQPEPGPAASGCVAWSHRPWDHQAACLGDLSYVLQDSCNLLITPAPHYLFCTSNQILSKEFY